MSLPTTKVHEWHRDGFFISTDPSLVDLQAVNKALESEQLPWAKALSEEELQALLQHSVWFGVYSATAEPADTADSTALEAKSGMIGLARVISDRVTMAYLTDVYILPEYQSRGLGGWLIDCVKEWWDLMPSGRQLLLITTEGKKADYYAKKLLTGRIEDQSQSGNERKNVFAASGKGARM